MTAAQRSALRSFRRVKDFLASHPLTETADGLGKQAQELDEVIEKLSQGAEEQEAGFRLTRAETRRQWMLREKLWQEHMFPITRIARGVFDPSGVDQALLLPKKRQDNDALIAAARGMAQAVEAQREVFVAHGLPQGFVESLRWAVSELEQVQGARVDSKRRHVVATATVSELVRRGRLAVRLLDAIVSPKLAKDPEWLAAWQAVKRPMESGGTSGATGAVDIAPPEIKVA